MIFMDKRNFLKIALSSSAGMLSLKAYSNAVSPHVSLSNSILANNKLIERTNSAILSAGELKVYLNEINKLNLSLVEKANTTVFKPKNARSILIRKNQFSESIHETACAYYNSKLFYRLIANKSNTEIPFTPLVENIINSNYKNIDNLQQLLIEKANKMNEEFIWLTLNKHNLKFQLSGGKATHSSLSTERNCNNHLTAIAIDMRHETYSASYKNKQAYVKQVVANLNWTLFNKRIERFIG